VIVEYVDMLGGVIWVMAQGLFRVIVILSGRSDTIGYCFCVREEGYGGIL